MQTDRIILRPWAIILKETNEAIGAMGYMPDCPLNLHQK